MDTFVVAVLDDEAKAYKAGEALRDLHKQVAITVHAAAIIAKSEDGAVSLKQSAEEGPVGAATGVLVGAIVGVLAGPAALAAGAAAGGAAALAGMAAGGAAGGVLGMTGDLVKAGIDSEFLEMVQTELRPGRAALIASVDEGWALPIDKAVAELGGRVFRQERVEIIDDTLEREAGSLARQVDDLLPEYHAARESDRDVLAARISELKTRLEVHLDRVGAREAQVREETEIRLDSLNLQIRKADGETRNRFQKRKAHLEAETSLKLAKLGQATTTTTEALSRASL